MQVSKLDNSPGITKSNASELTAQAGRFAGKDVTSSPDSMPKIGATGEGDASALGGAMCAKEIFLSKVPADILPSDHGSCETTSATGIGRAALLRERLSACAELEERRHQEEVLAARQADLALSRDTGDRMRSILLSK